MNKNFIILVMVMSMVAFASSIFDVIFPLYLDSKQISLPKIGMIFAFPILLSVVTRVIVGTQADSHGRKLFYSFALVGGSIANFLFAFANNTWQFFLINVFGRFSQSFGDATDHLLIYESVPNQKAGTAFGTIKGIVSILFFVGTLAAGAILVFLGYANTLIFCALFLLVALPIFLRFKERKKFEKVNYSSILEVFDFRSLPRNLKIYAMANFLSRASISMIAVFSIQLYLTKIFGFSPITLSIVLAGYTLLYALGSIFLGKLSDIYLPQKVYMYSYIFSAIAIFAIGFFSTALLVSVFWVILGAFLGIGGPALKKMQNMYARPKFRGRDTNVSAAIGSIGDFAGPLIAGYIGTYGFNPVFIISGIFLASSAFVMNLVKD